MDTVSLNLSKSYIYSAAHIVYREAMMLKGKHGLASGMRAFTIAAALFDSLGDYEGACHWAREVRDDMKE